MIASLDAAPVVDGSDSRPVTNALGITALLGTATLLTACGGGDSLGSAELPPAMMSLENAQFNPAFLKVTTQSNGPRATIQAVATPDAGAFMDWAERFYPAYFPGPQTNISSDPYVYRYYAGTGNYLGVVGNDIYILGPATASQLVKVGTLADFAAAVNSNYATAKPTTSAEAVRFLLQAQFSASDAEIAASMQQGYGGADEERDRRAGATP